MHDCTCARGSQATERKVRLDDSYYLHRFLSDYRDLVSWVHDMKTVMSADELAKDVAGAEALLERHQEHKVETDRRHLTPSHGHRPVCSYDAVIYGFSQPPR